MVREVKTVKKGAPVKVYGWIMKWRSMRAVDGSKIGEEINIKTMFKKRVVDEVVSIYIANVIIKDFALMEKLRESKAPVPVLVEGIKKWEKIYNNIDRNEIENTRRIAWIGLEKRGLKIRPIEAVPDAIIAKTGVTPPTMTFHDYERVVASSRAKLARQHRASGTAFKDDPGSNPA
jgi:hypothetical protein